MYIWQSQKGVYEESLCGHNNSVGWEHKCFVPKKRTYQTLLDMKCWNIPSFQDRINFHVVNDE